VQELNNSACDTLLYRYQLKTFQELSREDKDKTKISEDKERTKECTCKDEDNDMKLVLKEFLRTRIMARTGSTVVWVAPAGTSSDGGIGDTRRETEGRSDVRRASEPPDVFAGSLADVVDPTPSSMSGTSSRSR